MDDDRRHLLARREILAGYVVVLERTDELLRVCASVSGDSADARDAVVAAFDVSEIVADAILGLQVRRFTPAALTGIREQLADIDQRLTETTE